MREEQFLRLPSQGCIYSTSRIGNFLILGSGISGKVFANVHKRSLEELKLNDLPRDNIDIIGVDGWDEPFPVLGVTYVDTACGGLDELVKPAYLHIFPSTPSSWKTWCIEHPQPYEGDGDRGALSSGHVIASTHVSSFVNVCHPVDNPKTKKRQEYIRNQLHSIGCQPSCTIRLSFIPYHLCHVWAQKANDEFVNIFLLSGSDNRIHIYEPSIDEEIDSISFTEVETKNYFPELPSKFESVVTRIAIEVNTNLKKRITMIGCENGTLFCYICKEAGIPRWHARMDESVDSETSTAEMCTSVSSLNLNDELSTDKEKLLKLVSSSSSESSSQRLTTEEEDSVRVVNHFEGMITSIQFYKDGASVNAVVSSSASPVYCYRNILEEKFRMGNCLKFSSKWDAVEAICVVTKPNGENEIILGTFGCTLLVYKFLNDIQNWAIIAHRKFPSAIFSISYVDYYLRVVTSAGLHLIEYEDAAYIKYGSAMSDKTAPETSTKPQIDDVIFKAKLF